MQITISRYVLNFANGTWKCVAFTYRPGLVRVPPRRAFYQLRPEQPPSI